MFCLINQIQDQLQIFFFINKFKLARRKVVASLENVREAPDSHTSTALPGTNSQVPLALCLLSFHANFIFIFYIDVVDLGGGECYCTSRRLCR